MIYSSVIIKQKRFYTKEPLRSICISRFIVIGWDSWIKKSVNYLSCIEGKGVLKDINCIAQNAALFYIIKYLLIKLNPKKNSLLLLKHDSIMFSNYIGNPILTQRERDYYSKNLSYIEYFIIQWLKPVMRCSNLQNTRNYDAIQTINPPIFKIV